MLLVSISSYDCNVVPYVWVLGQEDVDFAEFYPETSDLHLRIHSTCALDTSILAHPT